MKTVGYVLQMRGTEMRFGNITSENSWRVVTYLQYFASLENRFRATDRCEGMFIDTRRKFNLWSSKTKHNQRFSGHCTIHVISIFGVMILNNKRQKTTNTHTCKQTNKQTELSMTSSCRIYNRASCCRRLRLRFSKSLKALLNKFSNK